MAVAVLLLALVSVALVSVGQLVHKDAQRTFADREDAQVRAFMLAGIEAARAELEHRGSLPAEFQAPLPPPFAEASLRLRSRQEDTRWHVRVESRFDERAMECEATFTATNGNWRVAAATPHATTSAAH